MRFSSAAATASWVWPLEDAITVAKYDKDQRSILEIQWFQGNPHLRTSMLFGIVWEDGFQEREYDADLADSQAFKIFVESKKDLYPLQFTVKEAKERIREIRKQAVTIGVGDKGYISLRYYDGLDRAWYDSLNLPEKSKYYVMSFTCVTIRKRRAYIHVPLFNVTLNIDSYDTQVHCYPQFDSNTMVEVTHNMRHDFPAIWK